MSINHDSNTPDLDGLVEIEQSALFVLNFFARSGGVASGSAFRFSKKQKWTFKEHVELTTTEKNHQKYELVDEI